MRISFYLYIPIILLNTSLVLLIIPSIIKYKINLIFFLLILCINIWLLTVILTDSASDLYTAMMWARLTIVGPIFIPYLFYNFALSYGEKILNAVKQIFILLPVILLLLLVPTNFNVREVNMVSWGTELKVGLLYNLLYLYFLLYVILSFREFYVKYRISENLIKKREIKIISTGFFLSIIITTSTNILAIIFDFQFLSLFGPPAIIFYILAVFYAIIKYQFLDIKIFFSRLTYYAFMGSIFFLVYFIIYYFDIIVFGGSETLGGVVFGIFFSVFFAILFSKLIDILRKQVRSRLINPGYDPLEVLNELNKQVAKTLKITEIAKLALDTLEQTLRPAYMGILIIPKDKSVQSNIFLQRPENSKKLSDLQLDLLEKIWKIWTQKGKSHLNIDVLQFETPKQFKNHKKLLEKIKEYMKKYNIKLITPLKQTDDNIGILILGPKNGAYPYVYSEMDFVDGISNIVGLAVTRALYYLQVQDLNENLKEKIKIATQELKKKNISIRKMYNNLKKLRQREQDMMDIMGHELRTPLTITRNVLSIINEKLENNQPITEKMLKSYIPKAYNAAKREIKLVETMLSATKADAGRLQVRLNKVSVKDVLANTFEGYKQHAKNKGLKFIVKIPKKDLFVYADKLRLQEIVDNFTSNAIKYTMKGEVKVLAEKLDSHEIKISVIDTGMGIDENDLKNLGKKFFRAKQYLKGGRVVRPGGTGLGLYVSFNLVKLMGGKLEVKSKVGEGSLFAVIMPEYVGQKPRSIDQTFEDQTLEELKKLAE